MKYIQKGSTPQELRRWFERQPVEDGQRINCGYGDMPSDVRAVVKQQLLEEQGGLCCYTGMRVDSQKSHIEHFKPQKLCTDHEDVEYTNLLAAHPGTSAGRCQFGARAKDDWYDENLLVSPLHQSCKTKFRFDLFGRIKPAKSDDTAAQDTIERLKLNHELLTDYRIQAINAALFPDESQLSRAKLRKVIKGFCQRNTEQKFPHFCFVIQQAAQDLLRKAEQKRKRRQAIRNQARS